MHVPVLVKASNKKHVHRYFLNFSHSNQTVDLGVDTATGRLGLGTTHRRVAPLVLRRYQPPAVSRRCLAGWRRPGWVCCRTCPPRGRPPPGSHPSRPPPIAGRRACPLLTRGGGVRADPWRSTFGDGGAAGMVWSCQCGHFCLVVRS